MEKPSIDDTLSTPKKTASPDDSGVTSQPSPAKAGKPRWVTLALLGLGALLLIAAASAFGGYRSGIHLRESAKATQDAEQIQLQFALGEQELAAGEYNRARQRFEYVIRIDPEFPGAQENLAKVLAMLNTTATPTLAPTPTVTPTPDTRNQEELFESAQQALENRDWTAVIDTLLQLRKISPDFHAVEADGMLWLALRNRGQEKIMQQADLEGGIYDLTLAARFGPLDVEAQGVMNWAQMYITGASFWEVDWAQAVQYFSEIAPQVPGLRDGSGLTSTERYRLALIGYGISLAKQEEWCEAVAQFEIAAGMGNFTEEQADWYEEAEEKCRRGDDDDDDRDERDNAPGEPVEVTPPPETEPTEAPTTEPAPPAGETPVPTEAPTDPPEQGEGDPQSSPEPTAEPGG